MNKNEQDTRKRTHMCTCIIYISFFQNELRLFCFFFSSQRQTNKIHKIIFLSNFNNYQTLNLKDKQDKKEWTHIHTHTHTILRHSLTHAEREDTYKPAVQVSLRRRTKAYRNYLYGRSIIPDGKDEEHQHT